MTKRIHSEPIIGWGNRRKEDTESNIALIEGNPMVRFETTPAIGNSNWREHLWWDDDCSTIGISADGRSASWEASDAVGYVVSIAYPTEFAGSCSFGVLPEPLKKNEMKDGSSWYSRPDKYLILSMPYSSASLEKLLQITSGLSRLGLGPVQTFQWSDSRF